MPALSRSRPVNPNTLDTASFKAGDVLGFSGAALSSDLINVVTYGLPRWSISHVGILGHYNSRLLLFESTTDELPACEVTGRKIHGVQAHDAEQRIASYDGRVWHYPLSRDLFADENSRLTRILLTFVGRHYSEIGAFRAGGIGFSFVESVLHEENLHSLFCSELCAAAHNAIGIFPTGNAGRWNPNHLIRAERCRGLLKRPHRLR